MVTRTVPRAALIDLLYTVADTLFARGVVLQILLLREA
jgi:hypothetical protein